ncbi:unnamed protein product [Urochloa humidicola]
MNNKITANAHPRHSTTGLNMNTKGRTIPDHERIGRGLSSRDTNRMTWTNKMTHGSPAAQTRHGGGARAKEAAKQMTSSGTARRGGEGLWDAAGWLRPARTSSSKPGIRGSGRSNSRAGHRRPRLGRGMSGRHGHASSYPRPPLVSWSPTTSIRGR